MRRTGCRTPAKIDYEKATTPRRGALGVILAAIALVVLIAMLLWLGFGTGMSMDTGVRTPLVDMFRRGNVETELRMLAARGILAPRAHEQLALLAILVEDVDAAVATAARETIASIPEDALSGFLARGDVPHELRALFTTGRPATAATPLDQRRAARRQLS